MSDTATGEKWERVADWGHAAPPPGEQRPPLPAPHPEVRAGRHRLLVRLLRADERDLARLRPLLGRADGAGHRLPVGGAVPAVRRRGGGRGRRAGRPRPLRRARPGHLRAGGTGRPDHQPLAAAGRPWLPGRHRRLLRLRHVHRGLQRHRPGQGAGPDRGAGPHRLRRRRRRQRADRPAPALPQRRVGHPRPGPGDPRPARHHGAGAGRGRPRRGHHPGLAGPRGPHRHPDLPIPRGPAHRPREPAPQPPPVARRLPGHPHLRGVRPDHGGAGPDDLPGHRDHPQPRPAAPGREAAGGGERPRPGLRPLPPRLRHLPLLRRRLHRDPRHPRRGPPPRPGGKLDEAADGLERCRREVVRTTEDRGLSLTDPTEPYGVLVVEATRLSEECRYTADVLGNSAENGSSGSRTA